MIPAIEIKNLYKSFRSGFFLKKQLVLHNLSLQVQQGEAFGFLGPNGAGKTTTIRIINGLSYPDQGEVFIFGKENTNVGVKARVGFLPEEPYFYHHLTGWEFLDFYSQLFGYSRRYRHKRIAFLLELIGLQEYADMQLRKYSRGMLQRIGLAQALINDPQLVILDEPMSSLDPIGRRMVRDIIIDLGKRGKTVFFSSHILSDVEMVCDRVAIIIGGRIISVGKIGELVKEKVDFHEIVLDGISTDKLVPEFEVISHETNRTLIKVEGEEGIQRALTFIKVHKGKVISVNPQKKSLEDIFIDEIRKGGERE
ncbi:multidrug ABC transporter ATP-binding protein [bacterium (candidate division B38) B3_B38]|nr:MAG: multidrug ABC transporter ATP-binding protein [bacterium (candidate division B38) B3_B38]